MLEGYIGDWINDDKEVSIEEMVDTCMAIIDDPFEFDITLEDVYNRADIMGLNRYNISHEVMKRLMNPV